jgi:hypothetical protein
VIKRAPRPDTGFLIIRNDVVRDKRLSYRARGLLAAMLSHPDNWEFNREWLADQSATEGVSAIRTALKELERFGYLVRRRINLPAEDGRKGGRFGWEYVLYDIPQAAEEQAATIGRSATDGSATDGKPSDGFQPSKEELSRTTVEEDVPDLECPDSGRFAPFVGAQKDDQDDSGDEPPDNTAAASNWRQEDRDSFVAVVGEKISIVGGNWNPKTGTFAALAFYDALRKRQPKPIRWPGRLLNEIYAGRADEGVDDWLIDQGLERAS